MAAGLRRVGRGALGVLAWQAGMAVAALLAAILVSPRRVPDLARFTRSASFGQLQSAAAAWAGRNFELIEGGAPWLDRVGCWVFDRCETGQDSRPLSIPRDPPSVTCTREITVVYGLDDGLDGRLAELAAILGAAGWGDRDGDTTVPMRDLDQREPPKWSIDWSPVEGFSFPAVLETMPPGPQVRAEGMAGYGYRLGQPGEPGRAGDDHGRRLARQRCAGRHAHLPAGGGRRSRRR